MSASSSVLSGSWRSRGTVVHRFHGSFCTSILLLEYRLKGTTTRRDKAIACNAIVKGAVQKEERYLPLGGSSTERNPQKKSGTVITGQTHSRNWNNARERYFSSLSLLPFFFYCSSHRFLSLIPDEAGEPIEEEAYLAPRGTPFSPLWWFSDAARKANETRACDVVMTRSQDRLNCEHKIT